MTARWWYLRRGVAWQPLAVCCACAASGAGLLARWPSTALLVLPALLACCAAASAFLFDEPSVAVVCVTPRGTTWRRTARLGTAALPLTLWTAIVWWRPGGLPLVRSGWWLVGAATILLAGGLAALLSRHDVPLPGSQLAAGLVLAVLAPAVAVGFLAGVETPYPVAGFSTEVRLFWLGVASTAALVCAAALRPGLRP